MPFVNFFAYNECKDTKSGSVGQIRKSVMVGSGQSALAAGGIARRNFVEARSRTTPFRFAFLAANIDNDNPRRRPPIHPTTYFPRNPIQWLPSAGMSDRHAACAAQATQAGQIANWDAVVVPPETSSR
jgi:hypothetical protein